MNHEWKESINLGMYRTLGTCTCGWQYIHDGHNPEQLGLYAALYEHILQARLFADAANRQSYGDHCCIPDSGACCGPGSWCCERAGVHGHPEE